MTIANLLTEVTLTTIMITRTANMENRSILISGPALAKDRDLRRELSKANAITLNADNRLLANILGGNKIDLILLEISSEGLADLDLLKMIKSSFPNTLVVILNGGSRCVRGKAFQQGAKDVFRRPYKITVIAERINALLDLKQTCS